MLALSAVLTLATFITTFSPLRDILDRIGLFPGFSLVNGDGSLWTSLKFTTIFMIGACAFLWRDELFPRLTGPTALVAAVAGFASLFNAHVAEIGIAVLGGAALLWLGFKARLGKLQAVNDRWDISYGVYLYGWPIETALLFFNRGISPVVLTLIALPLALLAGTASWWLVERWTKAKSRAQPT